MSDLMDDNTEDLAINTTVRHNTYCHETAKDGRKCSLYFPHYGKHKPKHGIEADRFETGE